MSGKAPTLSAHFKLPEFAARGRVLPPEHSRDELRALCRDLLEPLRARFGVVRITSGYRTRQQNIDVGGAPLSFHRYDLTGRRGVAADLVCAKGSPREWAALLNGLGAGGLGLYEDFLHVDNRRGMARWEG